MALMFKHDDEFCLYLPNFLCSGTDITPPTTSTVGIIGGVVVAAIFIISVAVIIVVIAVICSKNGCGFVTTSKNET